MPREKMGEMVRERPLTMGGVCPNDKWYFFYRALLSATSTHPTWLKLKPDWVGLMVVFLNYITMLRCAQELSIHRSIYVLLGNVVSRTSCPICVSFYRCIILEVEKLKFGMSRKMLMYFTFTAKTPPLRLTYRDHDQSIQYYRRWRWN